MAEIVIKTVNSRRELNKFIAFPNKLFKDVPSYIPPLNFDEVNLLTDKNPSLDHCSREQCSNEGFFLVSRFTSSKSSAGM